MTFDIVVIWTLVIGFGLMMYVLLDGFDLGIGLLFLAVKDKQDRDTMVNSVAPVWDGNETWLVLGGAGLMAAFPLAYSVILEALYLPLLLMLLGLILRGVAFEFRFKAIDQHKGLWDVLFCAGSIIATFFQGAAMGALIQGIAVEDQQFAGGPLDWLSWFSLVTGVSLLAAYALLGSTWLIAKTEGALQHKMRELSKPILKVFGYALCIILFFTPFLNEELKADIFNLSNFFFIGFFVSLLSVVYIWLFYLIALTKTEVLPFGVTLGLLGSSYLIMILCLWPNIIPPAISIHEAAAPASSLNFALVGVLIVIPVILAYTYWAYFVFRGKVRNTEGYH